MYEVLRDLYYNSIYHFESQRNRPRRSQKPNRSVSEKIEIAWSKAFSSQSVQYGTVGQLFKRYFMQDRRFITSGIANIFSGISGLIFHLIKLRFMESVRLIVLNLNDILVGILQIAIAPILFLFKPLQVMFAFFRLREQAINDILETLRQANLDTSESRLILSATQVDLKLLNPAFSALCNANFLTSDTLKQIINYCAFLSNALQVKRDDRTKAMQSFKFIQVLQETELLNQENFKKAVEWRHFSNHMEFVEALLCLQTVGLLNQTNFDKTLRCVNRISTMWIQQHPIELLPMLDILRACNLLTQDNFNDLIRNNVLLSNLVCNSLWNLPMHLLNQTTWNEIVRILSQDIYQYEQRYENFGRYIGRLLQQPPVMGRGRADDFNPSQSTHTASVHKSVSDSATNLMKLYKGKFEGKDFLEQSIQEIKTWIESYSSSSETDDESPVTHDQIKAAQRCINEITDISYTFTDAISGISTREALALVWCAIHDEGALKKAEEQALSKEEKQKRKGVSTKTEKQNRDRRLNEAKKRFIRALSERQREYNSDSKGQDMGEHRDRPKCASGTFTNLINAIAGGTHTHIEVLYISKAGATRKFPALIRQKAEAYMWDALEDEKVNTDKLLMAIKTNGIQKIFEETIWPAIERQVTDHMLEEFGSAYNNDKTDTDFVALIELGSSIDLQDLFLSLTIQRVAEDYLSQQIRAGENAQSLLNTIKENGLKAIWEQIEPTVKKCFLDAFPERYKYNAENPDFIELMQHKQLSMALRLNRLQRCLESDSVVTSIPPKLTIFSQPLETRSLPTTSTESDGMVPSPN